MYEELIKKVNEARINGKKIGLVQGSWDLFHLGHLRYILKAKELCDFLIVAMDSDEKIRKRKGNSRPIIPEDERYEFIKLLNIASEVVIKDVNEPKWNLIKNVKPDVLIAIKDNYTDEQIEKLGEFVGKVAILPRQSESSTSDKIRKILICSRGQQAADIDEKVKKAIEEIKFRTNFNENMPEPLPMLFRNLYDSTDWVCPVSAGCYWNGSWHFGANHSDFSIPKYDIENRTELYYSSVEHAEMNLLKKLGDVENLNTTIWTTLFPCDKCMKVLIQKGVKEIIYLEDHSEKNWSKRSHELAKKYGVKVTKYQEKNMNENISNNNQDMNSFKYIYPPNARHQEQLDIMMNFEYEGKDPLDQNFINQEILYTTDYWYITNNKFPYEGVEKQFLIVSRFPVYEEKDVTEEMWLDLKKIWINLVEKYGIEGGALCFRFGEPSLSGATLKRFHVHIIKPKEDERTKFSIGGKKVLKKGLYIRKKDN